MENRYFVNFLYTVSKWMLNTHRDRWEWPCAWWQPRRGMQVRPRLSLSACHWTLCPGLSGGERAHKELSRLKSRHEEDQNSRRDLRHLGTDGLFLLSVAEGVCTDRMRSVSLRGKWLCHSETRGRVNVNQLPEPAVLLSFAAVALRCSAPAQETWGCAPLRSIFPLLCLHGHMDEQVT